MSKSMPVAGPRNTRPNPYVGPRTFRPGEMLYGREAETNKLANLLCAERMVVLYSPSGAGKSSLINAALLPEMRERHFHVRPVARVAGMPAGATSVACNRYVFALLASLEEEYPRAEQLDATQMSMLTLDGYFKKRPRPKDSPLELLVIDQFEEVLTLDPTDEEAKKEFFRQLGEFLLEPSRWALFAMREEYVGALTPYGLAVPNGFRRTFRLDIMGPEGALKALREPAAQCTPRVEFDKDAALALITDLQRMNVQTPDGRVRSVIGPHVELVQLQVVAMRLWETLDPSSVRISMADVKSKQLGDVGIALAQFYDERVGTAARDSGIDEREVRKWFDDYLITNSGIRGQVFKGQGLPDGDEVREQVLDLYELLQTGRILRAQERGGAIWYELSHDRLIDPVRTSNRLWFDKNLGAFQKQSELWRQRDRSDDLLLGDEALSAAQNWIKERGLALTATEKTFLELSLKKADEREQRARERARLADEQARRLRQLRWGVAVLGALLLAVGATMWAAVTEKKIAERQTAAAMDQKKIAESQTAEAKKQAQIAHEAEIKAEAQERIAKEKAEEALKAQAKAWQSLAVLAFMKDEARELEKAFADPYATKSTELKFEVRAPPEKSSGATPLYNFTIKPDEKTRIGPLANAKSVQYLPGIGFDHKLRIGMPPKFEFSYLGWGCMRQVWVMVTFQDEATPPKMTEIDMCKLLGWDKN